MAFLGIFFIYIIIFLIVLFISTTISLICFIISLIISKNWKKKNNGKLPLKVFILRGVSVLTILPLAFTCCLLIYSSISSSIDKKTNLARAVTSYDYELAEKILKKYGNPDVRDDYGRTLLTLLVNHDSFKTEKQSYDFIDIDKSSIDLEDKKMIDLLLKYGADINSKDIVIHDDNEHYDNTIYQVYNNSNGDSCGNTPLIYAVSSRTIEFISYLIENGADVNIGNASGFTPALICADLRKDKDGGYDILKLLVENGANLKVVSNYHQDITWLVERSCGEDKCPMMINVLKENNAYNPYLINKYMFN